MRTLLRSLSLLLLVSPALAGRGAGELLLDRGAVAGLLASATPREARLAVPGLGDLALQLEPPAYVEFLDGGIEGDWIVRLPALDYRSRVRVRLVPGLEPLEGLVRLEVAWAQPESLPPGVVDLGPLLPPVELPRSLQGTVPGLEAPAPRIRLDVQGLEVLDERVRIRFGLSAAP